MLKYSDGLSQSDFFSNDLVHDATLRNLEPIGRRVDIRTANPDIEWRRIIATRNRLIHGDLGIDSDTLWRIIRDDVAVLGKV